MRKLLIQLGLVVLLLIGNFGFSSVKAAVDNTNSVQQTLDSIGEASEAELAGEEKAECTAGAIRINGVCTHTFSVKDNLTTDKQNTPSRITTSTNPIGTMLVTVINTVAYIIGSMAFLGLVVGGFLMIASNGNSGTISKGKMFITYSIIGLIIVFTAFFIVAFVQGLLFESFQQS